MYIFAKLYNELQIGIPFHLWVMTANLNVNNNLSIKCKYRSVLYVGIEYSKNEIFSIFLSLWF